MKLFLSHSSSDKTLATKLKEGILAPIVGNDNIYYSSLPETGTRPGQDWQEAIVSKLKEADIVILLVTHAFDLSKICQRELGMALALSKSIVAISTIVEWDDPLNKLHYLTLDKQDAIIDWAQSLSISCNQGAPSAALISRTIKEIHNLLHPQRSILKRGEVFESIIDATFSIVSNGGSQSLRHEIKKSLEQQVIPEKFLYQSVTGTSRWMDLCMDPLYTAFSESHRFLNQIADDIVGKIDKSIIESSPDLISLGPGTGHKDVTLLNALLNNGQNSRSLFYYPYDISKKMLEVAHSRISSADNIRERIKIKCVLADFHDISHFYKPVFDWRREANIVLFLGNTIGNMPNEVSFLTMLHRTMHQGDYFVLEVRLNSASQSPGGNDDRRKAFNLSPLEELGIAIDPHKLRYDTRGSVLSQVNNTISIKGIYEDFTYEGREYKETVLCCINLYDPEQMEMVLERIGFEILLFKKSEDQSLGLWLTRKYSRVH